MVGVCFKKMGELFSGGEAKERPPLVYLISYEQIRIYQGGGQMDYNRMARKLREKVIPNPELVTPGTA